MGRVCHRRPFFVHIDSQEISMKRSETNHLPVKIVYYLCKCFECTQSKRLSHHNVIILILDSGYILCTISSISFFLCIFFLFSTRSMKQSLCEAKIHFVVSFAVLGFTRWFCYWVSDYRHCRCLLCISWFLCSFIRHFFFCSCSISIFRSFSLSSSSTFDWFSISVCMLIPFFFVGWFAFSSKWFYSVFVSTNVPLQFINVQFHLPAHWIFIISLHRHIMSIRTLCVSFLF